MKKPQWFFLFQKKKVFLYKSDEINFKSTNTFTKIGFFYFLQKSQKVKKFDFL